MLVSSNGVEGKSKLVLSNLAKPKRRFLHEVGASNVACIHFLVPVFSLERDMRAPKDTKTT